METEFYTWPEAREEIKKASYKQNEIEIPAILNSISWKNLNCLELTRNADLRIPIALKNYYNSCTILTHNLETISEINSLAEKEGIKDKIRAFSFSPEKTLPKLPRKKYDLVYAEWISHSWLQNNSLLEQLLNLSEKYFLLIMPSPNSDDTQIASIGNPYEKEKRIKTKDNLIEYLNKAGWKTHYSEHYLPLHFPDKETAIKTFYTLAFNNKISEEQKEKLERFLTKEKAQNLDDSFYLLWAEK